MADTFIIRLTGEIDGEEVHPSTFDLAVMLRFLNGILSSVNCEAKRDSATSTRASAKLLALSAITDRCTEMSFVISPTAKPAVNRISAALSREDLDSLSSSTQKEIRGAFEYVTNKGVGVQLLNGKASRVYTKERPLPQPKKETFLVEESTSLLARVFKVGGKKNAAVQATFEATNQTITVNCSATIAKRIADEGCLYEIISLIGKAEWRVNPWSIASFTVTDFSQHFKGKASKLLDSLDKEFVDSFKEIDVDAFMKEVRGEDTA